MGYAQPNVTWSLINGTGADPYTGFDQFNRVVDNRWFNSSNADLDRIQHAYDRASNCLWRKNTVAEAASANLDELYAYDGLQRLAEVPSRQRGGGGQQTPGLCLTRLRLIWFFSATQGSAACRPHPACLDAT